MRFPSPSRLREGRTLERPGRARTGPEVRLSQGESECDFLHLPAYGRVGRLSGRGGFAPGRRPDSPRGRVNAISFTFPLTGGSDA